MTSHFADSFVFASPRYVVPSTGRTSRPRARARAASVLVAAALSAMLACLPAFSEPAPAPAPAPPKPQGWLGVALGSDTRPPARDAADEPAGVPVAGVIADGPARRAGLRARDRILAVDGTPISSPSDLITLVRSYPPDGWATFTVRRGEHTMDLKAFLQARPDNAQELRMLEGYVGAEAIDLTPELREHFGAPHDAGVMISKVADGSPAAIAGLFLGDVVFEVDGEPIRSGQALRAAFSGGGVDNRIEVRLMRDGAEITVEPLVTTRPERDTRSDED